MLCILISIPSSQQSVLMFLFMKSERYLDFSIWSLPHVWQVPPINTMSLHAQEFSFKILLWQVYKYKSTDDNRLHIWKLNACFIVYFIPNLIVSHNIYALTLPTAAQEWSVRCAAYAWCMPGLHRSWLRGCACVGVTCATKITWSHQPHPHNTFCS